MMKTAKKLMTNESGIYPSGDRVLIKPDAVEDVTKGGIIVPQEMLARHQMSAYFGYVVALGPDCFQHTVHMKERYIGQNWKEVERKTIGYSEPFADVGDRVAFAIYAGKSMTGSDGEEYKMMNDEDIMGRVDEDVTQTTIEARKPLGV